MAQNLFDNAKFGDMFLTAENKQAVFLRFAENSEHKFAILYIEGWGNVQVFRHNGKEGVVMMLDDWGRRFCYVQFKDEEELRTINLDHLELIER